MAKKMKKRLFKKKVGILHEQYYAFADRLPSDEDREKAYKWLEDLVANSAPRSINFDVLWDKMYEMYDTIVAARGIKEK
jgi:hypothetical protein